MSLYRERPEPERQRQHFSLHEEQEQDEQEEPEERESDSAMGWSEWFASDEPIVPDRTDRTTDWVPGQVIVSFDTADRAAERAIGNFAESAGADVLATVRGRLERLDLPIRDDLGLETWLISVPEGEEVTRIGQLLLTYVDTRERIAEPGPASLMASPNARMRLASTCANQLDGSAYGDQYRQLIGADAGSHNLADTSSTEVAILDSGIDLCGIFAKVSRAVNFVDENLQADDDSGHGTVVASIITELAPDATLYVCKIADHHGYVNEWNLLAALHFPPSVQVVNLSVALPLVDVDCPTCGRHPRYSRSLVLERLLDRLCDTGEQPLVVAAAGNDGLAELAYPARFKRCIAVGSISSSRHISGFSNYGTADHDGQPHENRFVLPGGEHHDAEYVREHAGTAMKYWGTSFSAAYASGVLLNILGDKAAQRPPNADVLDHLRSSADPSSPDYQDATHGNGIMQLTYMP